MQSLPPFFTEHIKSSLEWRQITSAKALVDLSSKQQPHCRSQFILRFFGWRAAGISNPARREFFIPFLPESASVLAQLLSFFSFKKADRFLPCRRFWPAAQRSWPSLGFCFSTSRHRGSGLLVWPLQSSGCFCFANKFALPAQDSTSCDVRTLASGIGSPVCSVFRYSSVAFALNLRCRGLRSRRRSGSRPCAFKTGRVSNYRLTFAAALGRMMRQQSRFTRIPR